MKLTISKYVLLLFPFAQVIVQVQKSPITVEVSILKLNLGTGVATFFCSENEK